MSKAGYPYDNAPMKRYFNTLKNDLIYQHYYRTEDDVAYNFSNGFVEGTNSRLKMIERTMYGRCGKQLLEAKLRYMRSSQNG